MATQSFVGSNASSNSTSVSMPGGIASGHRAFFFDEGVISGGTPPTQVNPSGWTLLGTQTASGGGLSVRHSVYYKDLTGSETTITGMAVNITCNKAVMVFSKSAGAWDTPADFANTVSLSTIASQTVNVVAGCVTVIGYGDDFNAGGSTAMAMSPAGTYAAAFTLRTGYILYGSGAVDNTVSSATSAGGILSSFYQRVSDGYTIAADTGAFSITGTAATLKVGRVLDAAAASYAITGTNATLSPGGKKVNADSGSFVITGTDAGFARTYVFAADSGSFAITGTDAALSPGGTVSITLAGSSTYTADEIDPLPGSAGQFALFSDYSEDSTGASSNNFLEAGSGSANDFTAIGTKITVSGGTFHFQSASWRILTAADIGELYRQSFGDTVTSGILARFSVTGGSFGTPVSSNQEGTTGNPSVQTITPTTDAGIWIGIYAASAAVSPRTSSLTATGEINQGTRHYLKYGIYNSGAQSGTVDMDDEGTNLLRSFWIPVSQPAVMVASAGSFTITGTAANTNYGRVVAADAGSYAVTGTAAGLSVGRVLDAASTTSFAVTGTDATFKWTRVLDAQSGAYAVGGTAASLLVGYRLDAQSGSYVITGTDATLSVATPGATVLPADAGAFVISGTDATLVYTPVEHLVLSADAGSYVITGSNAALVYTPLASSSSEGARGGGGGRRERGSAKINSRRIDELVYAAVAKLEAARNPQAPPPSPKAVLRAIKAQEIPDLSITLDQIKAAIARLRDEWIADNDDEEAAVMLLLAA